jgi:hypothetical protein
MENVLCLQLAELAERKRQGEWVQRRNGMLRALQNHFEGSAEWAEIDHALQAAPPIVFPDHGGTYEELRSIPLDPVVRDYCTMGVAFLDSLYSTLFETQSPEVQEWIRKESQNSAVRYRNPFPKNKSLAPSIPNHLFGRPSVRENLRR